jgi:alanine transaminase
MFGVGNDINIITVCHRVIKDENIHQRFGMPLGLKDINQHIVTAQYAVRGAIVTRATEIQQQLKEGIGSFPFDSIVFGNIGNPQALGQKPLTFPRLVMSLVDAPHLLEPGNVEKLPADLYPADVIARAQDYVAKIGSTGTGGYTHSQGYSFVREDVARFINERDGATKYPADPSKIFMTDGASPGVKAALNLLISGPEDGILIPIPQYPLYTAAIAVFNGTAIPYNMTEDGCWSLSIETLKKSYDTATANGTKVRCLVVINPGNPTGQVLDRPVMEEIVQFCYDRDILLMADEVYQTNVYAESKQFVSFRKVVTEMGDKIATTVPVVSLQTTSKGLYGECGRRGGYMEVMNMDAKVFAELYKMSTINLCPNVNGQVMCGLMVNPPKAGEPSFALYQKEHDGIFESLKRRAKLLVESLNKVPGITCNEAEGAMYAFPSIKMPAKFVAKCEAEGKKPDAEWAMQLLEKKGIVVVPGSGFGQNEGTYHVRTTILPPEEQMERVVRAIDEHHREITAAYA